jgi:hypothetical protein
VTRALPTRMVFSRGGSPSTVASSAMRSYIPQNIPRSDSRHTSFIGAPLIDATDSGAGSVIPSPMGRDQDLASLDNGSRLLAGPFPNDVVISAPARYVRGRRLTSRWLARTTDVSVLCPRVLGADNKTCPFAVLFVSPLTDSNRRLPPYHWRFPGGTGVHGRARAVTFFLQIEPSRRVCCVRACPRGPRLMYPSRTRGALSVCETEDRVRSGNGSTPPRARDNGTAD